MALDLDSLIQSLGSATPAAAPAANTGTVINPLTVSAPVAAPTPSDPQAEFQRSIYNNQPEQQMAAMGQAQNPTHTGMFGVKGSLRNILGVLGDAMLIQSGHNPMYRPEMQGEKVSDAMTGFQAAPMAAAGRLAAVPGASSEALQLYQDATQDSLRKQVQEQNNAYRQSQMTARQDASDSRLRSGIGGILTAAATPDPKTGQVDPKVWAQARATALRLGGKVSDFDESEIPDTPDQYNAGYGQTARQVQQGNISGQSIQERATSAANAQTGQNQRTAATIAGANGRVQPTTSAIESGAFQAYDQTNGDVTKLTPSQRLVINRYQNGVTKTPRALPAGLSVTPPSGGRPTPTASDLAYVKAHPEQAANFKAHFGVDPH